MIKQLCLINYRSHESTQIDLEPLTVFIGPIGAGKSNIFRGLTVLATSLQRLPGEYFGAWPYDFGSHRYRGVSTSSDAIGFAAEVSELDGFGTDLARYRIEAVEGADGVYITHERLDRVPGPESSEMGLNIFLRRARGGTFPGFGGVGPTDLSLLALAWRTRASTQSPDVQFAARTAEALGSYAYYHLEASQLRQPSPQLEQVKRLGYGGEHLPTFLSVLRDQAPEAFDDVVAEMTEMRKQLKRIGLAPAGQDKLGLIFEFDGFDLPLSGADESDGTLFTLGMLAILRNPSRPKLLAIEEPETGVHPRRLRWLVDELWDLSHPHDGSPPTQVLISTHSPYLLDHFRETPEVVRVVECINGVSRVRSLLEIIDGLGEGARKFLEQPLGEQWYAGIFEEF